MERNKVLKSISCHKNVGCKIQYTKMFAEDTVIQCKVWNSAGDTINDIHIKVTGKW